MSAVRLKTSTTSAYSQKIREVPSARPAANPAQGLPVCVAIAADSTAQASAPKPASRRLRTNAGSPGCGRWETRFPSNVRRG